MKDEVHVLSSLQRPKKIVLIGSDGKQHPVLCKPKVSNLITQNRILSTVLGRAETISLPVNCNLDYYDNQLL